MKHLVALFALLSALQVLSQPTVDWYKTYDDEQHYFDGSTCAAVDEAGNVYVSGEAFNYYNSRSSQYDIVTIKYSPSGEQLWVRKYHYFNYDGAMEIQYDGNNIYVLGLSQDSAQTHNFLILKYDINGVFIFAKRFRSDNYSDYWPKDMIVDPLRNYIHLIGYSYSSNVDSSHGNIYTINKQGDLVWQSNFQYMSNEHNSFYSGIIDETGKLIVCGSTFPRNSFNDGKAVIVKFDSFGNITWLKTLPGNSTSEIVCNNQNEIFTSGIISFADYHSKYSIVKLSAYGDSIWNLNITGPYRYIDYYHYFPPVKTFKKDNQQNLILSSIIEFQYHRNCLNVCKINSSGQIIWQYKDTTTIDPTNTVIDQYNNIYINTIYGSQYTQSNFRLIKISPYGDLIWKIGNINNLNFDYYPYGLAVKDNIIYTSGYSDVLPPSSDYLTVKYTQPIGIQPISNEIPDKFSLEQNYPNPFNPITKIRFLIPLWRGVDGAEGGRRGVFLVIYDVLGREIKTLVNEQLQPGTYEVEFDGTELPSGVYLYKIYTNSFTVTKKMILIK